MALSQSAQLGLATALFGVLSFVLAVLAELKKVTAASLRAQTPATGLPGLINERVLALLGDLQPPYGTPIQQGGGVVVCRFPRDPTVALGTLSALAAACSAALGALAVFFPYGGRHVPRKVLLAHTPLYVFLHVAV